MHLYNLLSRLTDNNDANGDHKTKSAVLHINMIQPQQMELDSITVVFDKHHDHCWYRTQIVYRIYYLSHTNCCHMHVVQSWQIISMWSILFMLLYILFLLSILFMALTLIDWLLWELKNRTLKSINFKFITENCSFGSHCEIALRWMLHNLINERVTLIQLMACCCQATTSHYLN